MVHTVIEESHTFTYSKKKLRLNQRLPYIFVYILNVLFTTNISNLLSARIQYFLQLLSQLSAVSHLKVSLATSRTITITLTCNLQTGYRANQREGWQHRWLPYILKEAYRNCLHIPVIKNQSSKNKCEKLSQNTHTVSAICCQQYKNGSCHITYNKNNNN